VVTPAVCIVRYEGGAYWPRLLAFATLARSLGVSMETLLYGENPDPDPRAGWRL